MKVLNVKDVKLQLIKKYQSLDLSELNEILMNVFDCNFTELSSEIMIPVKKYKQAQKAIEKFLNGQPVNKIFKKAYFYGNEFYINKNVLAPRQDSELLIELALKEIKDKKNVNILDLCTGPGILGITLCKNANALIDATDISNKALKIAKLNAKKLNANINFIKSNMFDKINKHYDIIISNPPYVTETEWKVLNKNVKKYDPKIALVGGKDGLKFYEIIAKKAKHYLNKFGTIILEIGDEQRQSVSDIFKKYGFEGIVCHKDYNDKDRALVIKN